MIPSADRHPGSASRSTRPPRLAGAVRDELAELRGRILGECAACGHAVYSEHSFTRLEGRVVHVRCPITKAAAR
jgi:hypothetical protein